MGNSKDGVRNFALLYTHNFTCYQVKKFGDLFCDNE